ncbi:protein Cft1p [[Candida] anglica]|uniref:Protein Cft1p n=1 Tax=[Candida] anglica TaxID=148631 RepID=A0ABP0E7R1_9ASCO
MDAYREFIEPTRVSHCIGCNFISPTVKHLVVAKATLLQVFEVIDPSSNGSYNLRLIEQFKLHGMVTDLKAIRTVENPQLDYILVATKFAKMSLIKWNHRFHSISTVSLHYYENSIRDSTFEKLTRTHLILEPNNNSCSCMRFKNLLTFLPFETLEDEDSDMEDVGNTSLVPRNTHGDNFDLYGSSFLMDAQTLDPSIGDIIDMQFLYNYREPTLAIIYVNTYTWAGNLPKVKDNINFMVLSLDLKTKTTTTVLKVENLPYDIDRVIALPQPFNGSLLLGANEIIHIDNGGITRRIAVNKYTESITVSTKNYLDQTDLNLQLENCTIAPIPNDNRLLMILEHGEFYYINFEVDGKSIKKIFLEMVSPDSYQGVQFNYPEHIVSLDNSLIFASNKNGDSHLLELKYDNDISVENNESSEGNGNVKDDDDDDDLYEEDNVSQKTVIKKGSIEFVLHDSLRNNGPISNFTLGHFSTEKFKANLINPNHKEISIVSTSGSGSQGALNIFTPSVQPIIKSSLSFSQINRMWTISKKYLITSDDINSKSEIFQINKSFARLDSKDFINNESTISMFEMDDAKFCVQITPKHVVLYNHKFKKVASLENELSDYESEDIIFGTLSDEFLLITLSSGEAMIFSVNTYSESFTKINLPKILSDTIITTGYITNSHLLNAVSKDINILLNRGVKRRHNSTTAVNEEKNSDLGPKTKLFVLVTGENRIIVFSRFHNEKCYQLNDIDKFSKHLSLGFFEPKDTFPDPFIKQVILGGLGDNQSINDEYLTVLTIGGEVILYKLYFDGENYQFIKQQNLRITGAPENAYPAGTTIERRLVYIPNCNGYSSIFITGTVPYWISKTSHSIPRIFQFSKIPAISFSSYSDSKISNGFVFLDNNKNARIGEIPTDFNYDNNWPSKRIEMKETVKSITFHESSNTFVISSYTEIPYNCIDEEGKPIVGTDDTKPPATSYKGYIKLLSTFNWSIIDTIELAENEVGMSVKSMVLDVGISSKRFKNKKEFIVVGTGKYRMEDLAANGSYRIIEIIDIIPEPGKPETNHKFKEFFKEDTRGAVTSICEVSGRFLVSQGQKIIIRDLQDNSAIPVAFLDTSVYVSEAKSFGNLLILGDSLKSIWLAGFDAEPFRMIMLGKDLQSLDVCCADFIVRDEDIFILLADSNNVLHVLQYDPDDPSSSNGQRLIQKSSFNVNSNTTCLRSLPKNEEINPTSLDNFQCIGSTIDGSFFVVFPISEATYRRMYILQQQIIDKEYHFCGLNPRLNRFGDLRVTANDINVKPLLDYDVISVFAHLTEDRKRNLSTKAGSNMYQEIWKDLIEFENVLKNL